MSYSEDQLIDTLLTTNSISQAAESLGCSRTTIYTHLANPEFKKAMDVRRWASMEASYYRLQAATEKAVTNLMEALDVEHPDTTTKLKAAISIHVLRVARQYGDFMDIKMENT